MPTCRVYAEPLNTSPKGLRFLLLCAPALVAALASGPSPAHETDAQAIQEIARQEVGRLLRTEGALDAAIEEGIKRIVRKQQAARENDRQRRVRVENLRPVDPRRDHISGDADAPVTLVEYSDFECPYCKRFHPTVIRLMEENRGQLRWVYRHFPLAFHNPGAQTQAEAAECVGELAGNDAFWEYIHALYRKTKSGGRGFPLDGLRPLAEETGVNGDAFDECMASGRTAARVRQDHNDGIDIGISGTPAGIFINRRGEARFVAGALPIEELQAVVDDLLR